MADLKGSAILLFIIGFLVIPFLPPVSYIHEVGHYVLARINGNKAVIESYNMTRITGELHPWQPYIGYVTQMFVLAIFGLIAQYFWKRQLFAFFWGGVHSVFFRALPSVDFQEVAIKATGAPVPWSSWLIFGAISMTIGWALVVRAHRK